jgi:polyphenol oxidase
VSAERRFPQRDAVDDKRDILELLFELPGSGMALFTTRLHGNLSCVSGEGPEYAKERQDLLCELLNLGWLCSSKQVHGSTVHVIEEISGSGGTLLAVAADAHVTQLRRLGAMVLTADCLPVALGCRGAVAMVHAGWRGLAAGVLQRSVSAMRGLVNDQPILAVVGPGAGVCCYEVGAEVLAAFPSAPRHGRHLDLRAIASQQLLDAGVSEVRHGDACTVCNCEWFFSHRREAHHAGRQAGIVWLS